MTVNTEQIVMISMPELERFAAEVVRRTLEQMKAVSAAAVSAAVSSEREYCYGIRGISELFGVCHATAQMYKNTFLRPAVSQRGRKIMVDVARARELFEQHSNGEK